MIRKINQEKGLYLFILLNPILDLLSSLFKSLGFAYTPSTFLRPLLVLVIVIWIFICDKGTRKKILIAAGIYLLYAVIHLYLYNNIITGISYGGVPYELQYLCNYTYLVFTLLSFVYVFYKQKNKLKDILFYNILFYISTIYLAIITNTSLSSYVEGTGYKGWFNTSGAVGSILVISLFILIPYLVKREIKAIYKYSFVFAIIFYLCFLIGSRVGLLGSVLVVGFYIFLIIANYLFHNKKINIKKYLPLILSSLAVILITFTLFGSYTLDRRNELDEIVDDEVHIAYDLMDIKEQIDTGTIEKGYMSDEQIRALNSLYDYANKINLPNVDLRTQQLIYHYYLYQYQDSIALKLFGNGYLANFGALTLEMEGIALIFNLGMIGFILFMVPFLSIFIYGVYMGIKHIKQIDVEYMMYISGIFVSYLISLLAGHVYFNTSVMPVIIIIHVLLLNKIKSLGESK
ncbi:MAG: O-antigen ligase family protein [Bacilli bacterium]|jgi:hypothetical protein